MTLPRGSSAAPAAVGRPAAHAVDDLDLVPLGDRWTLLQIVRLGLAAFLLAGGVVAPALVPAAADVALLSQVYVAVVVAVELLRRRTGVRGLRLLGLLLLVDGVYLRLALSADGAAGSSLELLLAVHISAVTLLASYRAGLKVTIWHTLILVVAEVLRYEGDVSATVPFRLVALWTVAAATAACSALNERELRRGRRELAGLASMAAALGRQDHPSGIPAVLLAHVLATFQRRRGAVVLLAEDGQATIGPDGTARPGTSPDPLVERCLDETAPVLVRRLSAEDAGLSSVLPAASNVIIVPLASGDEVLGALVVEHGGNRLTHVAAPVVARIGQFADQAALALVKARLHEEVARLASADGLTGIANRRAWETAVARELSRCERSGHDLSVLIVDVDHFKSFNDTYGHHAGDEVLRVVAATLSAAARQGDLPARYGGEEFVVLLPECGMDEASEVGERVRQAIEAAETGIAPVTASIGVATFPGQGHDGASLVSAADEALYHSKRAGRNRVTHARELHAAGISAGREG